MAGPIDGTALGCVALCKQCGRAIQLRRVHFSAHVAHLRSYSDDLWHHFTPADHSAVPKRGVAERSAG